MNYLGIDLGGTNIKGGVVTETGEIVREASRPTHVEQGPEAIADGIAALIRELEGDGRFAGVGLGCPGTVDDESGEVACAFNLGLIHYDLRGAVRARTGYELRLGNDANVAALAEALGGTGRILVRESGTEPLIRVMVEAESAEDCRKYVSEVVEVIKKRGHAV